MINDFDHLLQQCKARAVKRVLRIALRVAGSLALVGAGIFGYLQYTASIQPVVLIEVPKAIVPIALAEDNNSLASAPIVAQTPVAIAPVTANVIQPTPIAVVSANPVNTSATVEPAKTTPSAQSTRILEVSSASNHPMSPEQTYQRAPKFETALAIARDFYIKEDYAQAAVWAKKANQMNREAEEAWLLYAKSYYAQGKKHEAIGVLELYLNYKDSKAATELVKSWK